MSDKSIAITGGGITKVLPYFLLLIITQAQFYFFSEDFRKTGFMLLVWGMFTLVLLAKVTNKSKSENHEQSLPGSLLGGLNNSLFKRHQKDMFFLTRNVAFLFFILGMAYLVTLIAPCENIGFSRACFNDLAPILARCIITGLAFWTVQAYSFRPETASLLISYSAIAAIVLFAGLLYSSEVQLTQSFILSDVFAQNSDMAQQITLAAIIGLCVCIYLYALKTRKRHREFALAAIGLSTFLIVIETFYLSSPALSAVYFSCWSGMGVGWAQSWPRSTKAKRTRSTKGKFLTIEQI